MGIFQVSKKPNGNAMMDMLYRSFAAPFADSAGPLYNFEPCRFPANPVTPRRATLPSWVRRSSLKLRLPFGHAGIVTEHENGMKVAGGARDRIPAPITRAGFKIGSTGIGFSNFAELPALKRTIFLISLSRTDARLSACLTERPGRSLSPSVFEIAGLRAEVGIRPRIMRAKRLLTMFASECYSLASHAMNIARIEYDSKYC